jgi:hypothetical protein
MDLFVLERGALHFKKLAGELKVGLAAIDRRPFVILFFRRHRSGNEGGGQHGDGRGGKPDFHAYSPSIAFAYQFAGLALAGQTARRAGA